jgi:hypothetical protein
MTALFAQRPHAPGGQRATLADENFFAFHRGPNVLIGLQRTPGFGGEVVAVEVLAEKGCFALYDRDAVENLIAPILHVLAP